MGQKNPSILAKKDTLYVLTTPILWHKEEWAS